MSLPASDLSKQPDNRTTMELGAVLPETAEVRDGHLFIGGVDMVGVGETRGHGAVRLRQRRTFAIAWSVIATRSNRVTGTPTSSTRRRRSSTRKAVRMVASEGFAWMCRAAASSACALSVGFPAERVFMHGNNKTPRELEEAISAGIGRIVIDSRIELRRISEIAGAWASCRIFTCASRPGVGGRHARVHPHGLRGLKFGFNMRDDFAFNCVRDVLDTPNVRLAGLHCHIGSQIFALHSFREAADVMVEFIAHSRRIWLRHRGA